MEEVAKGMTAVQRATLVTNVNNALIGELSGHNCFIRGYGNEKYIACMSRETLEFYKENNFAFLEKIRAIHTVNQIPVTLSMGVALFPSDVIAAGKADFNELADKARAGLDLALGRGGDQVVVYEDDGSPHFYGGKTRSVEKNTRVRARVVSQAIHELIDNSEMVLVMGHEREDYDSLGAAVGVAHMARLAEKPVHVVLSDQADAVQRLTSELMDDPDFKDLIISPETAEKICNNQTLLFITDTHRPDMTAAPALLTKTDHRVVIDHHRRSSDFIQKPLLTYTETSSSSTSELVTELLQYFQEDVDLAKIEATALYAGIVVDTKNFAVQTGVRTFDAASYLRRCGADPDIVRDLFSCDFDTVKDRAAILSGARIKDGIAVASCSKGQANAMIIAAQAADALVNIDKVEASFTFYYLDDGYIGVSARSRGDINVQLVMEAIGGGGHRTVAGAQVKGRTMEEAQDVVMAALRETLDKIRRLMKNEGNLIRRCKETREKGDIVEVSEGYGRNFLLPRKLAAPGTSENINDAKQKKAAAQHKAQVASDEAVILASQLKKVELTIPVKVGEGGKVFGAITGKNISDAAKEQYDIDLDKKKVEIKDPIKSVGDYDVTIRVHPTITSVIKIHVVEG